MNENELVDESDDDRDLCPICLDDLSTDVLTVSCSHTFHDKCIKAWCEKSSNQSCPLCRTEIKFNNMVLPPSGLSVASAPTLEEEEKEHKERNKPQGRPKCRGVTKKRTPCKNYAKFNNEGFCYVHRKAEKYVRQTEPYRMHSHMSYEPTLEEVRQQQAILNSLFHDAKHENHDHHHDVPREHRHDCIIL